MRRILSDDGTLGSEFEQALTGAQRSLWRFEQQPAYAIDDEGGLFTAFRDGVKIPPTQAPGLCAWFDQVRTQTRAGMRIGRVRVIDIPPTEYQRWLQYIDRWNRDAGEEIYYLPRRAYENHNVNERSKLHSSFGPADWWLIDEKLIVIMHIDAAGVRTKVELSDEPYELARAIIFRSHAENIAREIAARETVRHAA